MLGTVYPSFFQTPRGRRGCTHVYTTGRQTRTRVPRQCSPTPSPNSSFNSHNSTPQSKAGKKKVGALCCLTPRGGSLCPRFDSVSHSQETSSSKFYSVACRPLGYSMGTSAKQANYLQDESRTFAKRNTASNSSHTLHQTQ